MFVPSGNSSEDCEPVNQHARPISWDMREEFSGGAAPVLWAPVTDIATAGKRPLDILALPTSSLLFARLNKISPTSSAYLANFALGEGDGLEDAAANEPVAGDIPPKQHRSIRRA